MAFEDNGVVIVTRITSSGHMDGIKVLANILVEDMDEDRQERWRRDARRRCAALTRPKRPDEPDWS